MKLELSQSVGIKAKLESAIDLVLEILRSVRDFSVFHEITFGEILFFLYVFTRSIWYLCFGVSATFDYYFSDQTWVLIFIICSVAHFVSFFFESVRPRAAIVLIYAVIWVFLALLAAFGQTKTPAVPTYLVFALGSIYIAVRLWTEKRD